MGAGTLIAKPPAAAPIPSPMRIDMLGSHLSVAGGYVNALREAERLGMQTVQIFTKNQRQWKAAPLDSAAAADWLAEKRRLGWTQTVSHASYLINLATPDNEHSAKSIDAMTDEMERAEALEIAYVVVHPGSSLTTPLEDGLRRLIAAVDEVLRRTAGFRALLCLETTVGGGSQIGGRFEHLAAVRQAVAAPERVGTCFDTCHVTAAGYDLSTPRAVRAAFDEFDNVVGLDHLSCFHLNDSKFGCGSHRDRHEHIGLGLVGLACFEHIMRHRSFAGRPKILETEKAEAADGTPWDTINLRKLRQLAEKPRGGRPGSSAGATASGRRRRRIARVAAKPRSKRPS